MKHLTYTAAAVLALAGSVAIAQTPQDAMKTDAMKPAPSADAMSATPGAAKKP